MLTGFLFVILIVCLAMMMSEGLWSNALTAINVTLAAMVATNWFEAVAAYMTRQSPSYTYVWDFLTLWALFALSFSIFRVFTDKISTVRVRFKMPVETAGRIICGLLTGWILICFTSMTLHTAPLARTAFRGSFAADPKSSSFFGMAPDRLWLGFMQSRSRGILSTSGQTRSSDPSDQDKNVFDPRADFIYKYGQRRQTLYHHMKRTGSVRVK